jgi:primase-polymerase (primpol)-like protein
LNDGFFHGVGFALTWELGVIGLHFDKCVDPTTGEITDRNVARWVDRFDSYTEFSGRGNGLNVLVKGIPRGRRRRAQNIQLFGPGRVLFATGKPMQNSSKSIKHRQEQLNDFYHEIFGRYSDLGAVRRDWELG